MNNEERDKLVELINEHQPQPNSEDLADYILSAGYRMQGGGLTDAHALICPDCGHSIYRHEERVSGDGCAGEMATETDPGYECACSESVVGIAYRAGQAAALRAVPPQPVGLTEEEREAVEFVMRSAERLAYGGKLTTATRDQMHIVCAAALRAGRSEEWYLVVESAPDDSRWVLGLTPSGRMVVVRNAGAHWEDDNQLVRDIRYWRELPPSMREAQKGGAHNDR